MLPLRTVRLYFSPCLSRHVGIVLLLTAISPLRFYGQGQTLPQFRIGIIDFFGTGTADLDKVRAELPIHEGDSLTESQIRTTISAIRAKPLSSTARPPTNLDLVCCDERKRWTLYIGLGMNHTNSLIRNPRPTGKMRLPQRVVDLYRKEVAASAAAVEAGNAGQDDSNGYSLSRDPATRSLQLQLRAYAIEHGGRLQQVLNNSSSSNQRTIAAQVLGYGLRSQSQIAALSHATRDQDAEVRNNAIRALWVISDASSELAASIPTDSFIGLLNSDTWSDRNKSSLVLADLTASRDPSLLNQIYCEALPSLIEMAHWRLTGHAYASVVILGRIAGMSDREISDLSKAQEIDQIIVAVPARAGVRGTPRSCPGRAL